MDLASKQCVPCKGGVPPLKGDELRRLEEALGNGWEVVDEHHLTKEFRFNNFREALHYVNLVGETAEALKALQQVVTLTPEDATAHYQLAQALQKSGDKAEAKKAFQRFAELKKRQNAEGGMASEPPQ